MNGIRIARVVGIVVGALILLGILSGNMFHTIDPGERAIVFKRFGQGLDKENVLSQGFKIIAPWNKMYKYDVRIQESLSTMEVLSKNGLTITIELTYRYKPNDEMIGYLHDSIGVSYHDRIIVPEIRSATREVIGKYLPDELYSSKREVIQDEIFNRTAEAISRKFLVLDAVLIRDVKLPPTLQEAIETKLKQEQEALEYEFRLEKASLEAQRMKIEAEGKATAYRIVSAAITENILREKGIEATLSLAQSPNTKVIVVGGGEDGLPLILGGN